MLGIRLSKVFHRFRVFVALFLGRKKRKPIFMPKLWHVDSLSTMTREGSNPATDFIRKRNKFKLAEIRSRAHVESLLL
jgi:hypothetical protein